MERVLKAFNNYKKEVYPHVQEKMESLAMGQDPHTFLITCADSRICTSHFAEKGVGEIFVIRNAGNVVEKYSDCNTDSTSVTLEYGVVALGIPEIIVCGHASCGAMAGIMDLDSLTEMPLVKQGLEKTKEGFDFDFSKVQSIDDLILLNVKQQLKNLMEYPFIKERVLDGRLQLWGLVYDFSKGELTSKFNFRDLEGEL